MSKMNWNRAIFYLLGAFTGAFVFKSVGRIVGK